MTDTDNAAPEMQLLLLCARSFAAGTEAITTAKANCLLAQVDDWSQFLLLVRDHHCVPVVYRWFRNIEQGEESLEVPEQVIEELRDLYLRSAGYSLRLAREANRIQAALKEHGVLAVLIKGPALAVQGFGTTSMRQFSDLDLVIEREDIEGAMPLLSDLGFRLEGVVPVSDMRLYTRLLKEWTFVSDDNRTILDIHTMAGSHTVSSSAMTSEVLKHIEEVAFDDDRRTIATVKPTSMLVIVCMGGACEMWKKLSDVVDVAALLSTYRDTDWPGLLGWAERWGEKRSVLIGVHMAGSLLGLKMPRAFEDALRKDTGARKLAQAAAQRIMGGGSTALDTVRERMFALRTRSRTGDGGRYLLRELFVPSTVELNMISLPRWLYSAYYCIRPIRLLWDAMGLGPKRSL